MSYKQWIIVKLLSFRKIFLTSDKKWTGLWDAEGNSSISRLLQLSMKENIWVTEVVWI